MRRILSGCLRSGQPAQRRQLRAGPGKEMGQHPRGRAAPRRHRRTRRLKLAQLPFPGVFGVFYQNDRPTKNALEKKWIESTREKTGSASDLELLQKTFDRMK